MTYKIVKLLKVSDQNNNKFYNMKQTSADSFIVEFGRVGSKVQVATYPMRKWNSKYNDEIRKGYTDVTHLYETQTQTSALLTDDETLNEILRYLVKVSQLSFNKSYSEGIKITKKQVEEAQKILNEISTLTDLDMIQKLYLKLFTVIPRQMKNVNDYLPKTLGQAVEWIELEQATLDNASIQGELETTSDEKLLDKLGVNMTLGQMNQEIEEILQGNTRKVQKVINLSKPSTEEAFFNYLQAASNKKTILAWHGTSVQNVLSICSLSLRVRPTNVANGSMLGLAAYISQEFQKSYNYTHGDRKFMFIYQAHVGNELVANTRDKIKQYTLEELQRLGFDSVFAPSGVQTGMTSLRYSERTVYRSEQLTPKYLLEVS